MSEGKTTPQAVLADAGLFEQNLEFFAENFPPLHALLQNHEAQAEVVFDDDDDPDVVFQETPFYQQGARKHAEKQMEKYKAAPNRICMGAVTVGATDTDSQPVLENMLARAAGAGITFSATHTSLVSYHAVCLGFGLGQHIDQLVETTQCRNLIIVEPNTEFLYQSLFVFDWQAFGAACREDNRWFHLLTDRNPAYLLNNLRVIYRQYGVSSFDGMHIFEHYSNPIFEPLKSFFKNDADLLFSGVGYFDDELNMIGNTYEMLASGEEKIFNWSSKNPGFPVFIIGSGPSLDQAKDVILEHQERAIIVSCGTSLGACLRMGIQPDFHVEMERGKAQFDLSSELVAEGHNLDDIWLIASTTLVPNIKKLFKKRAFFFRQTLSSYPVFSGLPTQCVRYPSPSVTNSGLSFAQDVGFREFYFFGIDLGFKDADHHHSDATSYHEHWTEKHDRSFAGNFGGRILSNYFYSWIRDGIKGAVADYGTGFKYYNCSDGAVMDNVIPMLPQCLSLPPKNKPKHQVVAEITARFTPYTRDIFDGYWRDGAIVKNVQAVAKSLTLCVEDHGDLYDKKYAQEINVVLDLINYSDGAKLVSRGTVMQAILAVEYYLDRIEQEDKRDLLAKIVAEELITCFKTLADVAEKEFIILAQTGRLDERFDDGTYTNYEDEEG